MTEPVSGIHPDTAELQAYADGEARDESVASHVASCATCREEVASIRRVTAALSLGSKPPGSLTERIHARRAALAQGTPVAPMRRPRMRARNFVLPIGLAAAAVLAVFVPRALREPPRDQGPPSNGAKGAPPAGIVVDETIVTETGPTSIDSISWDITGSGITIEVRYVTGRAESLRDERLAERVAEQLLEGGVARAAITVRPVSPQSLDAQSLPPGAVGVTVRGVRPPPAP